MNSLAESRKGTLTIVGTGIKAVAHTTLEARGYIEKADKLLYLVADLATIYWLVSLNKKAEDLYAYYEEGKPRIDTYNKMVDRMLACVREGDDVCVAVYGHPGVFATPTHKAIKLARQEGYEAKMLPGVSAADCLFADLGVDPGNYGCQMFEATDFLVNRRKFDPNSHLIIWQIGVIGVLTHKLQMFDKKGLETLIEALSDTYDLNHEVVVYQASQYAVCEPIMKRIRLSELRDGGVTPISTLYVPPKPTKPQPDLAMLERLGIGA